MHILNYSLCLGPNICFCCDQSQKNQQSKQVAADVQHYKQLLIMRRALPVGRMIIALLQTWKLHSMLTTLSRWQQWKQIHTVPESSLVIPAHELVLLQQHQPWAMLLSRVLFVHTLLSKSFMKHLFVLILPGHFFFFF